MDRVLEVRFDCQISTVEDLNNWFVDIICVLFLDTIWSIVQVTETGTLALTQQLAELRTNNVEVTMLPKQTFEVGLFEDYWRVQNCIPLGLFPNWFFSAI